MSIAGGPRRRQDSWHRQDEVIQGARATTNLRRGGDDHITGRDGNAASSGRLFLSRSAAGGRANDPDGGDGRRLKEAAAATSARRRRQRLPERGRRIDN